MQEQGGFSVSGSSLTLVLPGSFGLSPSVSGGGFISCSHAFDMFGQQSKTKAGSSLYTPFL